MIHPLSGALKAIGRVRDADVMLQTLAIVAGDGEVVRCTDEDELQALQELREKLAKERDNHLRRVTDSAKIGKLTDAIEAVSEWVESPVFESTLAHWPADLAAPQLLLVKARYVSARGARSA